MISLNEGLIRLKMFTINIIHPFIDDNSEKVYEAKLFEI